MMSSYLLKFESWKFKSNKATMKKIGALDYNWKDYYTTTMELLYHIYNILESPKLNKIVEVRNSIAVHVRHTSTPNRFTLFYLETIYKYKRLKIAIF